MTVISTQATATGSAAQISTSDASSLPLGVWISIGVTGGLFILILALFVGRHFVKRRGKQEDAESGRMQSHQMPMGRVGQGTMDGQTLMQMKGGPELPQVYLPAQDMQRNSSAVAWKPPSMGSATVPRVQPPQQALLHAGIHRSYSTNSLPRNGGFAKQAANTSRKGPPGPIITTTPIAHRSTVHGLNSVLKTRSSITGELLLVNNGVTTSAARPSPTWQPVARSSLLSVVENAPDLHASPTMQRRATVDAFIRAQQATISDTDSTSSKRLSVSPASSLQPSFQSATSMEAIPRLSTPFQEDDYSNMYDEKERHGSPNLFDHDDYDHLDAYIPPERTMSPAVKYPEVWFRPSPVPMQRTEREIRPSGLRQDIFLLDEDEDTSEEEMN